MDNLAHNDARSRQQQHRQALIVLNGNRERNRLLFWVALIVGLLLLVVLAATFGILWVGTVAFIFMESILGIPGLIGWRRAESKIARIQSELAELERSNGGNRGPTTSESPPNPLKIVVANCNICGKELVGAGLFCPACGARQN